MKYKNLNCCYRCPDDVIQLANKLILKVNNRVVERSGELVSYKKDITNSIIIYANENEVEEATSIVNFINLMIKKGYKYDDIAIIGRTWFIFDDLEQSLLHNNIKYIKLVESNSLNTIEVSIIRPI
jgi:superfamily I DNA/RNA helicase